MSSRLPQTSDLRVRFAHCALQLMGLAGANHLLDGIGSLWSSLRGVAHEAATGPPETVSRFLDPTHPDLLVFFAVALGSAVVEELLFRGLLFEGLRRRWGRTVAVFGSAALFGAVHGGPFQIAVAGLLGIQLGAIRELFGLRLAIGAHLLSNAFFVTAVILAPTGWLEGVLPSIPSRGLALVLAGSACAVLVQRWRSSDPAKT